MANITDITTGEQTVATAGAVTGTPDTSGFTPVNGGFHSIKLLVRGLSNGKRALFAIEDTANASPFSDATQIAVANIMGGMPTEGIAKEWSLADLPMIRTGAANNKLRLNCLAIDGTPGTVKVHCWLE